MIPFLLLFLLSRRSGGSASVHAPVNVLLFLLGWFQDLIGNGSCQRLHPNKMSDDRLGNLPGMNRVDSRLHSS